MAKYRYFILLFTLGFFLVSCNEDKGSESMPPNDITSSYEPMLSYLNEAIEDDPEDDELLYKRARVYLSIFRFKSAKDDINAALALKPSNADYFLLLSQIEFGSGNYFEAIKASEKAESIGEESPDLPILQANVYWEQVTPHEASYTSTKPSNLFHSTRIFLC